MKKRLSAVLALLIFGNLGVYGDAISQTIVSTKHNKYMSIQDIADIQVGLGSIMMEFGERFYIAYYAAKARNWKLADYQIHEIIEAQEIAEVTRPEYKKQLKDFEDTHLTRLRESIKKQNWNGFRKHFDKTLKACNACHEANEHGYIKYILPKEPPKYLNLETNNKAYIYMEQSK